MEKIVVIDKCVAFSGKNFDLILTKTSLIAKEKSVFLMLSLN